MIRFFLVCLGLAARAGDAFAQSPRAANPERPTVATHAYAVAPGYAELEQGVRWFGVGSLTEGTAWDWNLKIGLGRGVQAGFFGSAYPDTDAGSGVGDVGWTVKWQRALSDAQAVALVPAITVPTGDAGAGLGAGRVLGALTGVYSADLPNGLHLDLNAGPAGLGAGRPQWFASVGLAGARGRLAGATELFLFTAGAAGPRQRGFLGAVLVTLAEWAIVDLGGVVGWGGGTPDQVFVGLTSNFGRLFGSP
jgi:hypothetical protein